MADDFQVKQSSSSTPYAVTGALLGGAGAGAAAYYATRPKYGSYEELIAEKKDSFDKKLENVKEEDKKFLDAVKDIRDIREQAGNEYDAKVKALTEGAAPQELPEGHEALDKLKAAQQELEAKKKQLIDAKVKEMGGANIDKKELGKLQQQRQSIISKRKAEINKINTELEKLAKKKNQWAEIYNSPLNSETVKEYALKQLEKIDQDIAKLAENEVLGFGKNAEAKKAFVEKMKTVVSNIQAKSVIEGVAVNVDELNKLEVNADKIKEVVSKYVDAAKTMDAKYDEIYAEMEKAIKDKDKKALNKAINKLPLNEQEIVNKHLNKKGMLTSEGFDKAFEAIEESRYNTTIDRMIKAAERKNAKEAKELEKVYTEIQEALTKKDNKALDEAFKKLPENQQKKLQELLKNGWVKADFDAAIPELKKVHKAELEELKTAISNYQKVVAEMEKLGGKGAHFVEVTENGKKVTRLADKNGNIIHKTIKQNANFETTVKVPTGDDAIRTLDEKIAAIRKPETELREQAAKAIEESAYAAEAEKVKAAEKAVADAKAALPKGETMTLEKAQEAVNKELNVANRTEFVDGKVKTNAESLIKEYGEKLKHKWGFAEHTNWKIAGVATLGAVVIGGIASVLAPKDRA